MKLKEALLGIGLLTSVVSYGQTKQDLISNFTKVDNAGCVSNAYGLDEIGGGPTVYTNGDEVIIVENSLTENDARSTIKYNIGDNSLELDTKNGRETYGEKYSNFYKTGEKAEVKWEKTKTKIAKISKEETQQLIDTYGEDWEKQGELVFSSK